MTEEDGSVLYRKCVSAQSHWPRHGPDPFWDRPTTSTPRRNGWSRACPLPLRLERMLVLAPHLNHRFTDQTSAARFMWMEAHLEKLSFPKVSPAELVLDTENGVPLFRVQVDQSSGLPVRWKFTGMPGSRIRFWRAPRSESPENFTGNVRCSTVRNRSSPLASPMRCPELFRPVREPRRPSLTLSSRLFILRI